jgi:hypothetical protein
VASCDPAPGELELLFAVICHAGIAAFPPGAPVLNGLGFLPWSEATDSVPAPLLTEAGFSTTGSGDDVPLRLAVLGAGADGDVVVLLKEFGVADAEGFIL